MPRLFARCGLALGGVLACLTLTLAVSRAGGGLRTEDHNHDGRPDVWREYDDHGRLASVAFDTNFDGRSDGREYYHFGALVLREADRDYNDRVDFVQEFDSSTLHVVRTVEDTDADGAADVLVLFERGEPVFTKWVRALSRSADPAPPRTGNERLASLDDPFRADTCLSSPRLAATDADGVELTVKGLPAPTSAAAPFLAASEPSRLVDNSRPPFNPVRQAASRAPPIA